MNKLGNVDMLPLYENYRLFNNKEIEVIKDRIIIGCEWLIHKLSEYNVTVYEYKIWCERIDSVKNMCLSKYSDFCNILETWCIMLGEISAYALNYGWCDDKDKLLYIEWYFSCNIKMYDILIKNEMAMLPMLDILDKIFEANYKKG